MPIKYPFGSGGGGGGGITISPTTGVGDMLVRTAASEIGSVSTGSANAIPIWGGPSTLSANIFFTRDPVTSIVNNSQGFAVNTTATTVTRYVDPVGGNNANSGLDALNAWADINYALSQCPLLVTGIYRIEVAAGTNNQNILINDAIGKANDTTFGNSVIYINGAGDTATFLTAASGNIVLAQNCSCAVVLDNLSITGNLTQIGLRAVSSNVFLRDCVIDTCSLGVSSSSSLVTIAGGSNDFEFVDCQNCITAGVSSTVSIQKNTDFVNFTSFGIQSNSLANVLVSGSVVLNFTGSGAGVVSALQASSGSINIAAGAGAINISSVTVPYRNINDGAIVVGSGRTITLTDCSGGLGLFADDSYFSEAVGNTYVAAGTTPTQYVQNGNSTIWSASSIFDITTGWTRLHIPASELKLGADFRYKSYVEGCCPAPLAAGATEFFTKNSTVAFAMPLHIVDQAGTIDEIRVVSIVSNTDIDVYTVYVNGVATALTATMNNSTTAVGTGSVLVSTGDYISIEVTTGATTTAENVFVQASIRRQ